MISIEIWYGYHVMNVFRLIMTCAEVTILEIYNALVIGCKCGRRRYFVNHKEFRFASREELPMKCGTPSCNDNLFVVGYRPIAVEKAKDGPYFSATCRRCGTIVLRDVYGVKHCRECKKSDKIKMEGGLEVTELVYTFDDISRPWEGGIKE